MTYVKLLVVMFPYWFFRRFSDLSSSCSKILKTHQTQKSPTTQSWPYLQNNGELKYGAGFARKSYDRSLRFVIQFDRLC